MWSGRKKCLHLQNSSSKMEVVGTCNVKHKNCRSQKMTEHVDTAAGAKKQYTPSICMSNRCIKWFQSRERLACAQHWNSLKWRIKNQQSVHTMFTFQKLTDSTTWMCIVPMMVLWWYFSQCRRNLAMTSLWGSAQEFQKFPIPQRMPWGVSLRCGSCTLHHVGHIAPVAVCIYRTCRYLSKYVYIYICITYFQTKSVWFWSFVHCMSCCSCCITIWKRTL